jgi:hypothetical protein
MSFVFTSCPCVGVMSWLSSKFVYVRVGVSVIGVVRTLLLLTTVPWYNCLVVCL